MSGLESSTVTACEGTLFAAGPALRRSKGSPDEFSILEAARLVAHSSWDKLEQGNHVLEVVYPNRKAPWYCQMPRKLVIPNFHVIRIIHE